MDQVFSSNASMLTSFKRENIYHTVGRYKWIVADTQKFAKIAQLIKNIVKRSPIHFRHSLMRLAPTSVTNDNSRSLLQLKSFRYLLRNKKQFRYGELNPDLDGESVVC